MSESDYPAGAKDDPNAPYNEIDRGDCSYCDGKGCDECNHTGNKSEQQAQDEYESFKEDTRDE